MNNTTSLWCRNLAFGLDCFRCEDIIICFPTPIDCFLSLIMHQPTSILYQIDTLMNTLFIMMWLVLCNVYGEQLMFRKFWDSLEEYIRQEIILGDNIAYALKSFPVPEARFALSSAGVEQLVASLGSINNNGWSQLHIAVRLNIDVNIWKDLMKNIPAKQKVKLLKMKGDNGSTPLHIAAEYMTSEEGLSSLLETIDPKERMKLLSIKNDLGLTPLHVAAFKMTSGQMMRVLLETLNTQQRRTLLGMAVHFYVLTDKEILDLTPMHIAAATKNPDVLTAMLESLDRVERMTLLSAQCWRQWSPLHLALLNHNCSPDAVTAMLESLEPVERMTILSAKDWAQWSPLHLALLDHNCSPDVVTAMLQLLEPVQRMTLLSAKDCRQQTLAFLALSSRDLNYKVFEAMLDTLGAEDRASLLGQLCCDQFSPIHMAAVCQRDEVVITALLGPLDSDARMKLLSGTGKHSSPLHLAYGENPTCKCIQAWLEKLSSSQRVKLLCLLDCQHYTPVHTAAIQHKSDDVIKMTFKPLTAQQRKLLMDPEDKKVKPPLQLAIEHNSNLDVSKALLEQVPKKRKIETLMVQANGESRVVYADTEKHMAIMSDDEDMATKIEYLNLRSTSNKRLVHDFVYRKQFPQVVNFLSLPNRKLDVASCLVVFIAAKTGNVLADTGLIESISSHEQVSTIDKQYWELLTQYMETAAKGPLSKLLDYLACRIEPDHHVLLWKDGMDNTLLHLSAASSSKRFIYKAITSQLRREINEALDSKNAEGLTPYCLSKSGDIKNVLAWTKAQLGSYFLHTSPRAIIFYTDVDRSDAEEEKASFELALRKLNITPDTVRNPSVYDIYSKITENLKGEVSALIVAVFSHGQRGTVKICDGLLAIDAILRQMNSTKSGIPKILVVQACQEILTDKQNHDAPSSTTGINKVDAEPKTVNQDVSNESLSLDACVADSDAVCKAKPRTPAVSVIQGGQDQSQSATRHFDLPGPDMCVMAATINQQFSFRNLMIPLLSQNLEKAEVDEDLHEVFLRTIDEVRDQEPSQVPEYRSTMRFKLCLKNTFNEDLEYPAP